MTEQLQNQLGVFALVVVNIFLSPPVLSRTLSRTLPTDSDEGGLNTPHRAGVKLLFTNVLKRSKSFSCNCLFVLFCKKEAQNNIAGSDQEKNHKQGRHTGALSERRGEGRYARVEIYS
jgi:hypothetical protein